MNDIVYVIEVCDNFYDPDCMYILSATNSKTLAEKHRHHFEKHNPQGACSIIKFQDGLRLAEVL